MAKKKRPLATYIGLVVTALVIGSTVLISSVLYLSLSRRLTSEFKDRVRAEGAEIYLELKNQLNQLRNRLKELTLDNTIRVTLMLGVDYQLVERLNQLYGPNRGAHFFVVGQEGDKVFSAGDDPLADTPRVRRLLAAAPYEGNIERDRQGRFMVAYSRPIFRRTERLGAAACIQYFDEKKFFRRGRDGKKYGRLVVVEGGRAWDLFTGQPLEVEGWSAEAIEDKRPAHVSLGGVKGLAVANSQLPKLSYFVSLEELTQAKKGVFLLVLGLTVLVVAFSFAISLALSRKLARPLKELSAVALEIAKGRSETAVNAPRSNILEVEQLTSSLTTMLINLKKAEELKRYQELFEGVGDAVYIHDAAGDFIEANEVAHSRLGYSRSEFLAMNVFDVIPEAQHPVLRRVIDELLAEGGEGVFETELTAKDGRSIMTEVHARRITFRRRKVILNVVRDITARKRAEKELRDSENRYRATVQGIPDSVTITTLEDGRYIYVNDAFCRMSGYPREEVIGKSVLDLGLFVDPAVRDEIVRALKERGEVSDYEVQYRTRNGTVLDTLFAARPIHYADQDCLVAIVKDITAIKRTEEEKARLEVQLRQKQKMEAVGTLASGIAHDFNNILQAISGYVQLMLPKEGLDNPNLDYLGEIDRATERAATLVRQLLTFSRRVETELRPLDLNREVIQAVRMLERTIPKMIQLETNLAPELKAIKGDANQLEQVLMNLGTNARDAMPNGGRLSIETKNVVLQGPDCQTHLDLPPGEYVLLTVSDTGCGMDEETLQHIFEPFFTTKKVGDGTGLGLATVYGIVKGHGGSIHCSSQPGRGAVFQIYFPALEREDAPAIRRDSGPIKIPGGNETVLLVDDEPAVIRVAQDILETQGYQTITAGSGEEAVRIYRERGAEIDLVVLDLGMPGMGGQKCLERLLELDSRLKVIITSGYADGIQAKAVVEAGAREFLGKPYRLTDMLQKVRQVLDRD